MADNRAKVRASWYFVVNEWKEMACRAGTKLKTPSMLGVKFGSLHHFIAIRGK